MGTTKQVSLHGRRAYLTRDSELVGRGGLATGGEGKPSHHYPSDDIVSFTEDFLDTGGTGTYFYYSTGDTGTASSVAQLSATNGVVRLQSEATPLNAPTEVFALASGTNKKWKTGQGPGGRESSMGLVWRGKMESGSRSVKRQHVFVGFTDSGGGEIPAYDTGAGIITPATDLVGLIHSPGGDTGWSLVASANGTDQVVSLGKQATDNVYQTVEVEVRRGPDGSTAAFGYVNGELRGRISTPATPTVALAPWAGHWIQDTGARYFDTDYIHVYAPRDTGL